MGLTIDYGPFGFLDQFQIDHICNHSDQSGRYAYHRQPQIMHWNMACLASSMIPLLELRHSEKEAQDLLRLALEEFPITYAQTWQSLFRKKLGFSTEKDGDVALIERLIQTMHDSRVDFTSFFRNLGKLNSKLPITTFSSRDDFIDRRAIDIWLTDYVARLQNESSIDSERQLAMNQANPKYILRNHLAQFAIEQAQKKDFSEVSKLLKILSRPFDEQPEYDAYSMAPSPNLNAVEVSCSS